MAADAENADNPAGDGLDDGSSDDVTGHQGSPAEAAFVALVVVVMLCALVRGYRTPEVVVFLALLSVWNVGLLSNAEALSGFHNPGALVIGALFVVMKAIEKSGMADKMARRILGLQTSFSSGFLRLMVSALCMSAFLNNTPVVALLIPVTHDWARTRGFSHEALLMPVSFVSAFGGLLTIVGGGTNLVIQGLLYQENKRDPAVKPLALFEPAYVGLPLAIAGIMYLLVAAPRLLARGKQLAPSRNETGADGVPDAGGRLGASERLPKDRSEELVTKLEVTEESELIGDRLDLVLPRLGLPMDTLITVQRQQIAEENAPEKPLHSSLAVSRDGSGICNEPRSGKHEACEEDEESNVGGSWVGERVRGRAAVSGGVGMGSKEGVIHEGAVFAVGKSKKLPNFASLRRRAYARLDSDSSSFDQDAKRPVGGWAAAIAGGDSDSIELTPMAETPPLVAKCRQKHSVVGGQISEANGDDSSIHANTNGPRRAGVLDVVDPGGKNSRRGHDTDDDDYAANHESFVHHVADDKVWAGDILTLSCSQSQMIDFQGSVVSQGMKGIKVLGVHTRALPGLGTTFFDLVLSGRSRFVGRSARRFNASLAARYGCCVVGFRFKGGFPWSGDGDVRSSAVGGRRSVCVPEGGDGANVGCHDNQGSTLGLTSDGESPVVGASVAHAGGVGSPGAVLVENNGGNSRRALLEDDTAATISPTAVVENPIFAPLTDETVKRQGSQPRAVRKRLKNDDTAGVSLGQRRGRRKRRRGSGGKFGAGDVVMVLAKEDFVEIISGSPEFLSRTIVGRLPEPTSWFQCLPLLVFGAMLTWVLASGVDMVRAAFAACAVLILGGWVDAERAVGYVDWALLVLIGSALGFSQAIANSGLANYAGEAIRDSGMSRSASVYVLFGFTMICTELVTNNAAAALTIPIALSIARELEASYKPFVMAVLVAASCSFLTPIGTPTNTMVWKPGGYKFQDYARLGAPLALMYWIAASALIPLVFPF